MPTFIETFSKTAEFLLGMGGIVAALAVPISIILLIALVISWFKYHNDQIDDAERAAKFSKDEYRSLKNYYNSRGDKVRKLEELILELRKVNAELQEKLSRKRKK